MGQHGERGTFLIPYNLEFAVCLREAYKYSLIQAKYVFLFVEKKNLFAEITVRLGLWRGIGVMHISEGCLGL